MDDRSQQFVHGVPLEGGIPSPWTHYVAIGDSLSEGLGDPLSGGATRGWAHGLAQHVSTVAPELRFTNLAVRGHLARHAVERQLHTAVELQPDLVSVFIGGNDVLLRAAFDEQRFARELDELTAPFVPHATVVLSTLPDLTACSPLPPPMRGRLRQRIIAANRVIRRAASHHHTVLLDAWFDPRTRRHSMWSIDRIHPSAEGHRLIAASVAELLGVPVDNSTAEPARASVTATALRYGREAAWLLRYAPRRPRASAVAGRQPAHGGGTS